jgi:adenine-specific DNA methylase
MYRIEADFPIEQVNPLAQREANAKRPIYMLHKWWARRLGCVFRTIVLTSLIPDEEWKRLDAIARKQGVTAWHWFYYRQCHLDHHDADHTGHGCAIELIEHHCKDKIVLDPFMGGGTTVVEALRLGCKVIGVDVNPVAWFIVKKSIEPVDFQKLEAAFKDLEATLAPGILKWYRTRCPHGHEADVMYIFWTKTIRCSSCGKKTRLFNSFRLATKNGRDAVVCPECYCVQWISINPSSLKEEAGEKVTCPDCSHKFDPYTGFASGGSFKCEHCRAEDKTVDWVKRTGKAPEYEMFAVEYWCQRCYDEARKKRYKHQQAQAMARGYKGADDFDRKLYSKACREFDKVKHTLPLPMGDVYKGMKTTELLNHGLRRWQDLFNPRQLLCLGKLMSAILEIDDRSVRELFATTLDDAIRSNNMLCVYTMFRQTLEPLFSLHAYWTSDLAIENNVWGTKLGRGTFKACYDKTNRAIKWMETPEEANGNAKINLIDSPMTTITQETAAVIFREERCSLSARTAEDLSFLPARRVDVVITDPPYYGNVMYGELSDFFYVWLRLALKDEYPEFSTPLVPKDREIVVNEKTLSNGGIKDDSFFRQGLLRCFRECFRVLKDDGVIVFTFHHEAPKAWAAVLDSLLQAEFDIKRVWTYRSEGTTGFHMEGIRFDTVIVARKRMGDASEASWLRLQDEIVAEVQGELKRLLENGANLGMEDVFVLTMGKALAVYSRHYPKVMREGNQVKLEEAIDDIEGLVNEQIDAYWGLLVPTWLDLVSRIYLQTLAHRETVSRDQLVKMSTYAGVDFVELETRELMHRSKKKVGVYEVLMPHQRKPYLEKQQEDGEPFSPIDRAHWLYIAYKEGRSFREVIPQIYEHGLEEILGALAKITRDRTYERIGQELERLKGQGVLS